MKKLICALVAVSLFSIPALAATSGDGLLTADDTGLTAGVKYVLNANFTTMPTELRSTYIKTEGTIYVSGWRYDPREGWDRVSPATASWDSVSTLYSGDSVRFLEKVDVLFVRSAVDGTSYQIYSVIGDR